MSLRVFKQGQALPEDQLNRIRWLLYSSDLNVPAIAERTGCARSTVRNINKKFRIRGYVTRSRWILMPGARAEKPVNNEWTARV
jgi:DNA-binding MarR family transcriptional regulator